jgi:hypothetical protein
MFARERSCDQAHLSTFDFQAPVQARHSSCSLYRPFHCVETFTR